MPAEFGEALAGIVGRLLHTIQKGPPIKIGMVCDPRMGGSSAVAANLGSELARRSHTVHFLMFDHPFFNLDPRCKVHVVRDVSHTVRTTLNKDPAILTIASKMEQLTRKEYLQILHVHYALPYAASAYFAKQMLAGESIKVPVITTLHGTDVHTIGPTKDFKSIMTFTLRNSDGVTAVSRYLANATAENFGRENVRVIHNFINPEKFSRRPDPRLRSQYARPDEKIIFHASNFRPIKRIGDILKSFALASRQVPSRLVLAGDGPERPSMEALAKKLDIQNKVVFLGQQSSLPALYSISDLSMLVSELESFGMTLIESMACGTPVIATRAGGMPEVLQDGIQGRLVEVGDTAAMANAITDILSDDKKRQNMGKAGRKRVLSAFTPEKIVPKYERYYRGFL